MDDNTNPSLMPSLDDIRTHILTHWKLSDVVLATYPTGTAYTMTLAGASGCLSAIVVLYKKLLSLDNTEDHASSLLKTAGSLLTTTAFALRGTDTLHILPGLCLAHGTQMIAVGMLKDAAVTETVHEEGEGDKQS